jgi:hypothetical protein
MTTRCRRRKCCSCNQLYQPDPRSRFHQKYCSEPACRKASKAASQQRWRESDKGRDYFRGSANRQRVKDWRAAHPGYAKGRPRPQPAKPSCPLQDQITPQTLVPPEVKPSLALQEMIVTQSHALTGLIVTLAGHGGDALQDDIAPLIHQLIRLGQQVQGPVLGLPAVSLPAVSLPAVSLPNPSNGPGGVAYGGHQASALQGAAAASAPAVQLGGSPRGPPRDRYTLKPTSIRCP